MVFDPYFLIDNPEITKKAFLIIIEMFCLSLLHHYAFPVQPFIEGGIRQFGKSDESSLTPLIWHSFRNRLDSTDSRSLGSQ